MKSVLVRLGIIIAGCVLALSVVSCDAVAAFASGDKNDGDKAELEDGKFSFYVVPRFNVEVTNRYTARSVVPIGDDGEQIGTSFGPFDDKFKVVIDESYKGKALTFIVELERSASPLDGVEALKNFPLAVSILKSFHYVTPNDKKITVPGPGETVYLPNDKPDSDADSKIYITDLVMGHSEGSKQILENIPNLPPLYKVELVQNNVSSYTARGYRAYIGFLTLSGKGLRLNSFAGSNADSEGYAGFCAGDDWYMIVQDPNLSPGDSARIWIVYTHATEMPRLYYQNVVLPGLFGTVVVTPTYAAIPVDKDTLKWLTLPQGTPDISNFLPPGLNVPNVSAPSSDDSYVLISETYDISRAQSPWGCTGIFENFSGKFYGGGYEINEMLFSPKKSTRPTYYGLFMIARESGQKDQAGVSIPTVIADVNLNIDRIDANGTAENNATFVGGICGNALGLVDFTNNYINVRTPSDWTSNIGAASVGYIAGQIEAASRGIGNRTDTMSATPAYGAGNPNAPWQ